MTGHLAIETERLRREYRRHGRRGGAATLVALDDVTLSVRRGEVFGLLGVNGAGKTTLLQVLATQQRPTSGTARVAGFDVARYPQWVRRHISVVRGGDGPSTWWLNLENHLWMTARANGVSAAEAPGRVRGLLDAVGMTDRRGTRPSQLSCGLRQKAHLVRGFVTNPKVLLLDQPTLGLDVAASREVRAFIRGWIDDDETRTVVLATNDLREANELCDRVAILDGGRLLACAPPDALGKRLEPKSSFRLETSTLGATDANALMGVSGVRTLTQRDCERRSIVDLVLQQDDVIHEVLALLGTLGVDLIALTRRAVTLEDVFLHIVGAKVKYGRRRVVA